MRHLITVLAAGLLLAGCTSTPAPAGLSDEDVQLYVDRHNREMWSMMAAESGPAPTVEIVRFVNNDEWDDLVFDCMVEAGVQVTADSQGSWSWTTDEEDSAWIVYYTCGAMYPVYAPQAGYLSDAQHAYLYDYYQDVLVPCFHLAGYETSGYAPTREAFNDETSGYWEWNPYELIAVPTDAAERGRLEQRCPFSPFRI